MNVMLEWFDLIWYPWVWLSRSGTRGRSDPGSSGPWFCRTQSADDRRKYGGSDELFPHPVSGSPRLGSSHRCKKCRVIFLRVANCSYIDFRVRKVIFCEYIQKLQLHYLFYQGKWRKLLLPKDHKAMKRCLKQTKDIWFFPMRKVSLYTSLLTRSFFFRAERRGELKSKKKEQLKSVTLYYCIICRIYLKILEAEMI